MSKTKEIATTGDTPFGGLARIGSGAGAMTNTTEMPSAGSGTNYVGFFTTKNTKAQEITQAIPGLSPGMPYLGLAEKGYTRLKELKFHLLDRAIHWVARDSANNPVKASKTDPGNFQSPLRENIEALVLVYTDDNKVVPAVATFNSAKSHVGRTANDGITKTQQPEWFAQSPDHKATAQIPDPRFRFTVNVRSWVAPAKGSGFPTVNARGTIKPVTPGEASLLDAAAKDPEFNEQLETVRKAFTARVELLEKLAAG